MLPTSSRCRGSGSGHDHWCTCGSSPHERRLGRSRARFVCFGPICLVARAKSTGAMALFVPEESHFPQPRGLYLRDTCSGHRLTGFIYHVASLPKNVCTPASPWLRACYLMSSDGGALRQQFTGAESGCSMGQTDTQPWARVRLLLEVYQQPSMVQLHRTYTLHRRPALPSQRSMPMAIGFIISGE